MNPQEYITTDLKQVARFIDKEIGVDYETTELDSNSNAGSIVVFDLSLNEHRAIRTFIDKHNLWGEY